MEEEEELQIDPNKPRPWYFHNATVLLGFLCLYPFILPLVWYNPYYTSSRKVMLTFMILVVSALLIKILMAAMLSV